MKFEEYIDNLSKRVTADLPTREINEMLYSEFTAAKADDIISQKASKVLEDTFKKLDKTSQYYIYSRITPNYLKSLDNAIIACKHDYGDYNPLFLKFNVEKTVCTSIKEVYENKNTKSNGRSL